MVVSDIYLIKNVFHALATQAHNLAMGLQNAAPPGKENKSMNTINYLSEMSKELEKISHHMEDLLLIRSAQQRP